MSECKSCHEEFVPTGTTHGFCDECVWFFLDEFRSNLGKHLKPTGGLARFINDICQMSGLEQKQVEKVLSGEMTDRMSIERVVGVLKIRSF